MSEESEDEKKFRVVDVQPEDLERADQRAGRSGWGGGDVSPGSASPADSQLRVSDGDDWQTITITTTVQVNRRGEVRSSAGPRGPRSAWVANDRWPGSSAPATNKGDDPDQAE